MKLWEVFKALAENPTDEYEATRFKKRHVLSMSHTGFYYLDIYNEQGELIPKILDGSQFNGNIKPDFEWEKVLQPVPWYKAVKHCMDGGRIKWESNLCSFEYGPQDDIAINRHKIENGNWYIL